MRDFEPAASSIDRHADGTNDASSDEEEDDDADNDDDGSILAVQAEA